MAKKQFYGISFPFTADDTENYYVDLNSDLKGKVRSLLMHLIFTPKGQRLRDPEFGTNLIKFIFEPTDGMTIDNVKNEMNDCVKQYIKGANINNISILSGKEDNDSIYVKIEYSVSDGIRKESDSFITKI